MAAGEGSWEKNEILCSAREIGDRGTEAFRVFKNRLGLLKHEISN